MIYRCTTCEEPKNFEPITTHIRPDEGPPGEYTLARCGKCGEVGLFLREDVGDGFENDSYYRLWPPNERHIGFLLPEVVRQSYKEAVKCETAKAYVAAVVMVRRALEAVTTEHDPTSRNLHGGMKAMLSHGVISQELFDWGNALRAIGNQGAHPTKEAISSTDAVEALDFLQAMLEILYDLRPKFERMLARRSAVSTSLKFSTAI